MSDTDTTTEAADDTGSTDTDTDDTRTGDDPVAEVERLRVELQKARKWEERAKANAKAAKELEEFRQQSMTEAERAIEQARTEARREALTEVGAKVAAAEIRAAATGRMSGEQLATLLDNVNLARFIGDDGEVDRDAVSSFVEGIAPPPAEQVAPRVDLGQGTRNPQNMPLNGDPVERALKDALGIR
jgi:hypothetical protein